MMGLKADVNQNQPGIMGEGERRGCAGWKDVRDQQVKGHHSVGKSWWEKPGSFLSSQYVLLLTQVSSFDFL